MSPPKVNPEPGGPCPVCDGTGGQLEEACPQWTADWIDCKACEGSGEYWPNEPSESDGSKVTP